MFFLPIYDINKENVKTGDVFKFTFTVKHKVFGLCETILAWLIDRQDKFAVESVEWNDQGELEIMAKVAESGNPLPFIAVFGIIIAGAGTLLLIFGLTLTKVEKVMSLTSTSVMALAGSAIAIKLLFFK